MYAHIHHGPTKQGYLQHSALRDENTRQSPNTLCQVSLHGIHNTYPITNTNTYRKTSVTIRGLRSPIRLSLNPARRNAEHRDTYQPGPQERRALGLFFDPARRDAERKDHFRRRKHTRTRTHTHAHHIHHNVPNRPPRLRLHLQTLISSASLVQLTHDLHKLVHFARRQILGHGVGRVLGP